MADVKISALPAVPVAVATTDLFAIVQGGVTYKATLTEVVAAIPDATGSTRGILSAADWTTFNSKQSALTFSTGLTNAAGTVTVNLSTGVATGQILRGGINNGENLTITSTAAGTKGKILFGTSAYDEVNNRLGIGTQSPVTELHIEKLTTSSPTVTITSGITFASVIEFKNGTGGVNFSGSFLATGSGFSFGTYDLNQANLVGGTGGVALRTNNSGHIRFYATNSNFNNSTVQLQMFANTGNLVLQNGGTFTDAGFRLDVNGTARIQGDLTINTKNIITDTTTGTKIGTATGQKLGFWNAAPIAQPTTAVTAATLVGGGGTNLTDTDTFDGYTLQQVVKALRNAGLLA